LAKHGVFFAPHVESHEIIQKTSASGNSMMHHIVKLRTTFYCEDGSFVDALTIGEAADSGDKGAGKAQSYALKVAVWQTFCVPTEDIEDPDATVVQYKTAPTTSHAKWPQSNREIAQAQIQPVLDEIKNIREAEILAKKPANPYQATDAQRKELWKLAKEVGDHLNCQPKDLFAKAHEILLANAEINMAEALHEAANR
jgi:hypothetical protein